MRSHRFAGVVLAIALAALPSVARATPLDFIPVGDPLEDELRILDVLGADSLPHLGARPLSISELPSFADSATGPAGIAHQRLRRALTRDRVQPDTVTGASPRLLQRTLGTDERLEGSAGLEGSGAMGRTRTPGITSPSGLHLRLGAQVERWVAHAHVLVGYDPRRLLRAEPLIGVRHLVQHSDEAYLAYRGASGLWAVQMGRTRWHWGPGEEAGLLLSKTSAPLTGMALDLQLRPLHIEGTVLSVTLDPYAGEQLAAHRLEWQPTDALRLGLSEAARYRSERWEPLYQIGVLPYSLVQDLQYEDHPDSVIGLRNNVQASFDAAWRIRPGLRVYGEILIDDLRTTGHSDVSKYGYLFGGEGVARAANGRLSWGVEYTRLTRFVYTSFYGESFTAQDAPLGYPTGPDSRRISLRGAWDPNDGWQISSSLSHTDLGESGLDHPFVPGQGSVNVSQFLGVVEHATDWRLGLRYWPSAAVDLAVTGRVRWVDNAVHLAGDRRVEPGAELRLRLVR